MEAIPRQEAGGYSNGTTFFVWWSPAGRSWRRGRERSSTPTNEGKKRPERARRTLPPAVGKDEVPGPNPGSSSKEQFLISVLLADIRNLFYVCWF